MDIETTLDIDDTAGKLNPREIAREPPAELGPSKCPRQFREIDRLQARIHYQPAITVRPITPCQSLDDQCAVEYRQPERIHQRQRSRLVCAECECTGAER